MEDSFYCTESDNNYNKCRGYELIEDRRLGTDIPTCRCDYSLCRQFSGYCPVRDS